MWDERIRTQFLRYVMCTMPTRYPGRDVRKAVKHLTRELRREGQAGDMDWGLMWDFNGII